MARVTDVEQMGEWAGRHVGRVWVNWGQGWAWVGFGDADLARLEADRLRHLTDAEIAAWWEAA